MLHRTPVISVNLRRMDGPPFFFATVALLLSSMVSQYRMQCASLWILNREVLSFTSAVAPIGSEADGVLRASLEIKQRRRS